MFQDVSQKECCVDAYPQNPNLAARLFFSLKQSYNVSCIKLIFRLAWGHEPTIFSLGCEMCVNDVYMPQKYCNEDATISLPRCK